MRHQAIINDGQRYERAARRDARMRRLSFWAGGALCVLTLAAIWQDRALAPPVHDRMQAGVGFAMGYVQENEALAGALAGLQEEVAKLARDG